MRMLTIKQFCLTMNAKRSFVRKCCETGKIVGARKERTEYGGLSVWLIPPGSALPELGKAGRPRKPKKHTTAGQSQSPEKD